MAPQRDDTALSKLHDEVAAWVFFHLGADARVRFTESDEGCRICFRHVRVHDYCVTLSLAEIERMSQNPSLLEDRLLDELARHRRSR